MQPFSQTLGYAVLALSCLARSCRGRVQAPEVASCSGVPLPYLRKVLQSLAAGGLVATWRGRDGGVELARPAPEISLWDVALVVEPEVGEKRCLMGLTICSDEHACPLHEFWKTERVRIEEHLRATSLEDVATFGWTGHVASDPVTDKRS
jgi:Rrf2 family protein